MGQSRIALVLHGFQAHDFVCIAVHAVVLLHKNVQSRVIVSKSLTDCPLINSYEQCAQATGTPTAGVMGRLTGMS